MADFVVHSCCLGEAVYSRATEGTAGQNRHPAGGRLLDRQNQISLLRHCEAFLMACMIFPPMAEMRVNVAPCSV